MVRETIEEVEIIGVRDGPEPGLLELLLTTDDTLYVKEEVWEPFEALLLEGKLKVMGEEGGQRVSRNKQISFACLFFSIIFSL